MSQRNSGIGRRSFLKALAAGGVGSLLGGRVRADEPAPAPEPARIPKRPFGKSGIDVPILALGGMFDINNNQLLLRQAAKWGVTYFDTADCYEGGKSEPGFGKFFASNPGSRNDTFLVTKSDARDPDGMTKLLDRSLERMKIDTIDLYFVHGIGGIDELNDDTKAWAARAKKEGRIRLFGFSTHRNMADCLDGAAKLGWVDGIMFTYNYRLMHEPSMQRAVDACAKAGVGLTAMKTQGGGSVLTNSDKELELAGRFLEKGFSQAQAKLKAVWEDPRIASICSQMPNLSILSANVSAALDRTKLDAADRRLLREYAAETGCGYCTGCSSICHAAVGGRAPVSDVMRCLMYYHSYGDRDLARTQFRGIPAAERDTLASLDYAAAERQCPQGMPIARLMREASELLA